MAKTGSKLADVNILLGVSGGIAAYKAVDLASKLTAAGAKVDCIMTKSARKFIRPKSFEAVTGRAVYTSLWRGPKDYKIEHIDLADKADIVVIAPATANTAVQKNVETIKQAGFRTVGPEVGRLASGAEGIGRMTQPDDIIKAIEDIAAELTN